MIKIEINQDLTDLNYFLVNKKAMELWEFQKQQSEMCSNCERSDFTSDLDKRNPILKSYQTLEPEPLSTHRGFWYEGIWMELDEDQPVEDAIEEIRGAIIEEHLESLEDKEYEVYKQERDYWEERGWIFEDQPVNPRYNIVTYSEKYCEKERSRCKFRYECEMYPKTCDRESCMEYEPQF